MVVGVLGYASVALVAGALAAGGSRDRATAAASSASQAPDESPAREARRASFPSLSALLYSRDDLSTARSLLQLSGVAGRLERSRSGHTLLLPVNSAFSDVQGFTDYLARPANAAGVRRVMRYHVIDGRRGLYAGANLASLTGEKVPIRAYGDRWWAGDARLVGGPMRFPNGIAYLVDGVLLAPGERVGPASP